MHVLIIWLEIGLGFVLGLLACNYVYAIVILVSYITIFIMIIIIIIIKMYVCIYCLFVSVF